MDEVTIAEFAAIRQRHIHGRRSPCSLDFDDHIWSQLRSEDEEKVLVVLCYDCGILPIELLMLQPIVSFDA